MLTKSEQKILDHVRKCNQHAALAGLGTDPCSPNFFTKESRFVKRLADSGAIVWMPSCNKFGAGWALREEVANFYQKGYKTLTWDYYFVRDTDNKVFQVKSDHHTTTIFHLDGNSVETDVVKVIQGNEYVSVLDNGHGYTKVTK